VNFVKNSKEGEGSLNIWRGDVSRRTLKESGGTDYPLKKKKIGKEEVACILPL